MDGRMNGSIQGFGGLVVSMAMLGDKGEWKRGRMGDGYMDVTQGPISFLDNDRGNGRKRIVGKMA